MATTQIVGTDKYGFELRTCTRCNGSGHYSRNSAGDTTCYGCNGTTTALTAKASKAKAAWLEANTAAGAIDPADVKAGMRVVINGRRLVVTTDATEPKITGASIINGVRKDRVTVSFNTTSGSWNIPVDMKIGTPGIHVDPAPYVQASSTRKAA